MAQYHLVVIVKTRWKQSCVRLVKLRPLLNAVLANAVHQAQLETQAKMVKTENRAKTVTMEAQAKMPNRKNNSCRYRLNAIATLLQVAQAKQDPKDPTDHQAMLAIREVMDNPDLKDHQAHQAHLANQAKLDRKDPMVIQEL